MNKENTTTVIGLMSGTSLDGLDMVCCDFSMENERWSYQVKAAKDLPYTPEQHEVLSNAFFFNERKIMLLDDAFGQFLGNSVVDFILENDLNPAIIASHGHTIFHQPENKKTLQIGSGRRIADLTKITTINNFRQVDVLKGGQGAPLVPIGDMLLFGDYEVCLNIGGICNISYQINEERLACDVAPANMVLNALAAKMGLPFDQDGGLASGGRLDPVLLSQLNQLDYYALNPPKSLAREWVEGHIMPILENSDLTLNDQLATFCEHIALQIALSTEHLKSGKMLVTGGGAFNTYLINRIRDYSIHRIVIPNPETVRMKEAIVFAFIGLLRWRNEINCLKSVTGADSDSSAGDIYLAPGQESILNN